MAIDGQLRYSLKLRAAYYYYEKDMTKNDIADLLKISRITLGRLLREAKEEGLVKIEIIDERNMRHCLDAEEGLKARFALRDARVVDVVETTDKELINRQIAVQAARYVERQLKSGMTIGIAWGRTLQAMVKALQKDKGVNNIEIVTMLGLAGTTSANIMQPNILAQMFLEKYGGKGYVINAPFICDTQELAEKIKSEQSVELALKKSGDADITLIGVGQKPEDSKEYSGYYNFDTEALNTLKKQGAVGDICANFFNINGELLKSPVCKRVVSINPEALKLHKKVIMIGGGPNKHLSLLGALRGGFADVVVTDYQSAMAVLNAK